MRRIVALFILCLIVFFLSFFFVGWNNFGICDLWFGVAAGVFCHCIGSVKILPVISEVWILLVLMCTFVEHFPLQ